MVGYILLVYSIDVSDNELSNYINCQMSNRQSNNILSDLVRVLNVFYNDLLYYDAYKYIYL